jgi:hypothetical protein
LRICFDGDPEALQFRFVTDTGLHQYLRGMDRSERQHGLKVGAHVTGFAVMRNLHAGDSLARESYPRHQCVSENCQIGPVHQREGVRTENGLTFSSANYEVEHSSAPSSLHHPTF